MSKANRAKLDIEQMSEWCLIALRFLPQAAPPPAPNWEAIILAAKRTGNARELQAIMNFFREWLSFAPSDIRDRFDAAVRERIGSGLQEQDAKAHRRVERALGRGRIVTDDEFRLLIARIDEIGEDSERHSELEQVNRLLAEYEERRRK